MINQSGKNLESKSRQRGDQMEEIKQAKQVHWLVFGKIKHSMRHRTFTQKARSVTFVRL